MKKLGILFFAIGIILMLIIGFNALMHKDVAGVDPTKEREKANHPFPWYPTVGAVLIAGGIILMATSPKTRVNKKMTGAV